MQNLDEVARAQLRERLGLGARYDSPAAPARELTWARRGTAYFARKLNELTDGELDLPSRVPGWSRRHIVAHVGYNARALSRLVESARKGFLRETIEPELNEDIEFGSTLPAHALRYLFNHSEVHLNVEWRDLPADGWDASVQTVDNRLVPIRQTPLLRAREVWLRALDLGNTGTSADIPAALMEELRSHGIGH